MKKGEKKPNIKIITLGCSKNLVDSEVLMSQLKHNDFTLRSGEDAADIAVINTCGFIEAAKQESIDTILHAVQLKKEGKLKKVIVMGCLSERYADDLRKEIPEVDEFVGANKMDQVVEVLGGAYKYELLGERTLTTPQHFAYLKISEGCDRPCSFCSIPLMRGTHASKPIERIILEARRLAALGVKELILIAQDSTYYGLDLYGKRVLADVLEKLAGVEGIEWIRLLYAFPTGFPEDILEQLVEDWIVAQPGWFVKHNIRFRPVKGCDGYSAKQDCVHSDIDILAVNSCTGQEQVRAVTCKSWQGGFDPLYWKSKLESEAKYADRTAGVFVPKEAWKHFRELVSPKWTEAFLRCLHRETGQRDFVYYIAVTRLRRGPKERQDLECSRVIPG